MFSKQLFERICNLEVTYEELESFNKNIREQEFDLEQPFEKYYRVEQFINAIEKHLAGEITAEYLSAWANAYDWIIMGGFKLGECPYELKYLIRWTISDNLDALAFYDENTAEFYQLNEWGEWLRSFDEIYRNRDEWELDVAYAKSRDKEDTVLLVNHKRKLFADLFVDCYCDKWEDIHRGSADEAEAKMREFIKQGYRQLKT